jgi:ABC-type lipoprotein export system ATPase subunit
MIRCSAVCKSYRLGGQSIAALQGVDLVIDRPGFYGIMGASGSGKSTLLHLLAGLDQPDAGTISVAGTPLHTLGERDLTLFRRHKIGIIFQQFNLIPTLTAQENVELPGVLAGQSHATLRERSTELLTSLGVSHRLTHRPDSMSGGEQQRVAIARALLFNPGVVLADEPTGNLDTATTADIMALFARLNRERGLTLVLVTHNTEVAAAAQRVVTIRDGTIQRDVSMASEIERELLLFRSSALGQAILRNDALPPELAALAPALHNLLAGV